RPTPGQLLHLVDDEVAAVVALARVALAVLVGEDAARRLHHLAGREVLRRDQLERRVLALQLAVDDGEHLGVAGRGLDHRSSSISVICWRRRTWRPPSNSVDSHTRRISSASA